MKVKELIAELKKHNDELEVILAEDEEGNAFHNPFKVQPAYFDSEEDEVIADEDLEDYPEAVPVVVIWP